MSFKVVSNVILIFFHQCGSATLRGNHTIQCDDKQDCTIVCQDYDQSCQNANIECPTSGNCDIICNSSSSCKNMFVTCPFNGNCAISCTDNSACQNANINGSTCNSLTMICNGHNACQNAFIDATHTNNFQLQCGMGAINTCTSLTLFVPPNLNGEKKATIMAGDQCSSEINGNPMIFYAQNGWNDINILNYIETSPNECSNQIGTMYCGYLYNISCVFHTKHYSNSWQCVNMNDTCNNPSDPIQQTEIRTLSTLNTHSTTNTTETTVTSLLLYAIIGVLTFCLCCLACICGYYINLTRRYDPKRVKNNHNHNITNIPQILATQSLSELPRSTKLVSVNSGSKSSINVASPTMVSSEVSGISGVINQNNKSPITMKAYRSYSNRSCSTGNEEKTSKTYLEKIDSQTPQPSTPDPITTNIRANNNTNDITNENMSVPVIITPIQPQTQTQHISVPSTTQSFQQSQTQSSNRQIIYQSPPQHQLLQMNAMMNQSAPPSLSEIIKNTNYSINQNPIPPPPPPTQSEQQSEPQSRSGSRYSASITGTINAKTRHRVKATPTESITVSTRYINSELVNDSDNENNQNIETAMSNNSIDIDISVADETETNMTNVINASNMEDTNNV